MIGETSEQTRCDIRPEKTVSNSTTMIFYTVGVMAYNEEANIKRTLLALLEQHGEQTRLDEIIVVASGCTDNTVAIVQALQIAEPRITLLMQELREGKASAINLFLQHAHSPVLALVGADIIPEQDMLETACRHFADPMTGMVGARPIPVNEQEDFIGYAVHLLWRLHDRVARRRPKLGEGIAFRNIIQSIPANSAVDEISIEAAIVASSLRLVYEPAAIVYNKGPMTVRDFLRQRRRIHAGHLKARSQEHYEASTMRIGPLARALCAELPCIVHTPAQALWAAGTVALEGIARLLGHFDMTGKRSYQIWQSITSSKVLEDEQRKLRRIYTTQSVIVFHITRADTGMEPSEREQLRTLRIVRRMLPLLRSYIRKDDLLSINGTTTLVAVLNSDRTGAELAAQRLREVMMSQRLPARHGQSTHLLVSYRAVSFAL